MEKRLPILYIICVKTRITVLSLILNNLNIVLNLNFLVISGILFLHSVQNIIIILITSLWNSLIRLLLYSAGITKFITVLIKIPITLIYILLSMHTVIILMQNFCLIKKWNISLIIFSQNYNVFFPMSMYA